MRKGFNRPMSEEEEVIRVCQTEVELADSTIINLGGDHWYMGEGSHGLRLGVVEHRL